MPTRRQPSNVILTLTKIVKSSSKASTKPMKYCQIHRANVLTTSKIIIFLSDMGRRLPLTNILNSKISKNKIVFYLLGDDRRYKMSKYKRIKQSSSCETRAVNFPTYHKYLLVLQTFFISIKQKKILFEKGKWLSARIQLTFAIVGLKQIVSNALL